MYFIYTRYITFHGHVRVLSKADGLDWMGISMNDIQTNSTQVDNVQSSVNWFNKIGRIFNNRKYYKYYNFRKNSTFHYFK